MLKNLKKQLSKKEKKSLGGCFLGIKLKNGYYFPLSGKFIKKENGNKNE